MIPVGVKRVAANETRALSRLPKLTYMTQALIRGITSDVPVFRDTWDGLSEYKVAIRT